MRWCSAILSLVLLVSSSAARDFSWPIRRGGASWGTLGQDEYHSEGGFPEKAYGGGPVDRCLANLNQGSLIFVETAFAK